MPDVFGLKIVGPAGSGIFSAGEIIFRSLVQSGYYVLGYPEYPSLIKGGHNTYLLTISDQPMPNNSPKIDVLLALTETALNNEKSNWQKDTHLIADQSFKFIGSHNRLHQPALIEVAKAAGSAMTLNTAMIGFLSHQLKLDKQLVLGLIKEQLTGKSETLLAQNEKAFLDAIKISEKYYLSLDLPRTSNKNYRLILNGSQAAGLGAIAAGLNLYAGYPMTPSSPLLHYLSDHQEQFGYVVRQAEDEISAINMTVGASFAGARSMTGTSGGGFALMQEGVSLAGILETPVVIYLAMRPGPATGLPTWTSQSDLMFAIHSGHGEFPKIVLAPGDPKEAYHLTHRAFSLSQQYHLPVIVLVDKFLSENLYCLEDLPALKIVPISFVAEKALGDNHFPRYKYTASGVSNRTLPGFPNGEYLANSDEHQEEGFVDESSVNRNLQNQRRLNRLQSVLKEVTPPDQFDNGSEVIVTWGSHKYIGREVAVLTKRSHLHFNWVWPLSPSLLDTFEKYKKTIVIENNLTHQFSGLLRRELGINVDFSYGEDSGRPLDPELVIKKIKEGLS